jgi:HD domain
MEPLAVSVRHRLRIDQLHVGAPLPVDVYDPEDRLLLRRGNVIATESQLKRLIDEGLFSDQPVPAHALRGGFDEVVLGGRPSKPRVRVAVYADIVAAARRLQGLLGAPASDPSFVATIEELARVVEHGCALDPDAALAHILFARGVLYPARQQVNVAILTVLVLGRVGNDPARTHAAVCAALTMNLTIQAVQEVLYSQQEMTPEQREVIAVHPAAAARELAALGVRDPLWLACVEQHHEFSDGSGYPNKLAGAAVLREAQVIGLADRYCAAVTERGYRQAVAPDTALGFMRAKSGGTIAPEWIDELAHCVGRYPPGTVVSLFNRDVAVVTRRLRDARHPVVYALSPQNLRPFEAPRKRLTASNPQFEIERVLPREILPFPVDTELLWPRTVTDEASTQDPESTARVEAPSPA